MARLSDPIADSTALDGPRVDVAARLGWLLRVSRVAGGLSLGEMSSRLTELDHRLSVPALSTAERQGSREGSLIDAYERALGLGQGHLRAPVDVLCRTFDYSPRDRTPELPGPVTLSMVDEAFAPVLGGRPTGYQWFWWARVLRAGGGAALPSVVVQPLIAQLVGELVRSVGLAYVTRYEAIAQLRCGVYADLVEDVVRAMVHEEGTERLGSGALAPVAEQPTARLLQWCASLLEHPTEAVLAAACLALENMRAVGGLCEREWAVVVPHFARGHALADDTRGPWFTRLYKNLAPAVRREVADSLTRPLWPVDVPTSWAVADSRHYAMCERMAAEVCAEHDLGRQPMLARLCFEVVYDFRATRLTTSAWLLMASPVIDALQPRLLALAENAPDEVTRRGALRGLKTMQVPRGEQAVQRWLERTQPWDDRMALAIAANAGVEVPDAHLRVRAAGEEAVDVVEVLGMSQHPALADVVADPRLPAQVRAAARWWAATGGRVTL